MRTSLSRWLLLTSLLVCAGGILLSCSSKEEQPELEAEVKILNESVYVWNRGTQQWTGGGVVFLNERSLGIKRPLGKVTPKGFGQLPLREFRYNSKSISEISFNLKFVWVEVEGYAPRKFTLNVQE